MKAIDLSGKTALVTGAGSGIGQAIAVELGQCGAFVIVNYRQNEAGAQETLAHVKQAGGDGRIVQADVARAADVKAMFGGIERLDILVNNAGGLIKREKIADMSEALFDEVMAINVKSTFLCCQAAMPLMIGRGWGRIVNMSSIAAHDGGGFGSAMYAASKAAVGTFSKGLAKELAPHGITVNCVAPGLISTAFHDKLSTPEMRQATVKNTPLAREGNSMEVAESVIFLVSDMASFITGETMNINGGSRMC
ncbi:MAG: SDR family NAD(P)-dependent oxidoreductase [Aggregatilineales bacterium]